MLFLTISDMYKHTKKNPEVVDDVIVKYPFPVGQKNFDTPYMGIKMIATFVQILS